jgi:aromatic-L-amino-acid/L-tryptophan decarboxylase
MTLKSTNEKQLTLDPENWDEAKRLAHIMLDDMFEYIQLIRNEKIWQPIPQDVKQYFYSRLPIEGKELANVYNEFKKYILPYNKKNLHPRFWGWVNGSGTITGLLSDMIASTMNPNVTFGEQAACYVENQVINWSKEIFEYPDEADGILVSGGSVANLIALAVARNAKMGNEIRNTGLSRNTNKYIIYCSEETHYSVQKAIELLGLGNKHLKRISVDKNFKINLDELFKIIKEDKLKGLIPICVIANVGTVNTGAIDPIEELSVFCEQENLWFHIDGAFGAWLKILREYDNKLNFMYKADSISFDYHKWIYLPYDISCVLIKDGKLLIDTFGIESNYLLKHERGISSGEMVFTNKGLQLSRSFRALKVWFSIKENGLNKYKKMILQNIKQAKYLENLIKVNDKLELLAPVESNIVCFRFTKPSLNQKELSILNKNILMDLQQKGIAIPSSTIINGNYAIRVAITNHRSRYEDFDTLINSILKLAESYISKQEIKNFT